MLFSILSAAEAQIISAQQAYNNLEQDDIVIIDIRTPDEWKQTGVIPEAVLMTMHQPFEHFLTKIQQIKRNNNDKDIALICATGYRSKRMQKILKKHDIAVLDISEGYKGRFIHKGWVKEQLPIIKYKNNE